jgi:hypothetical protein
MQLLSIQLVFAALVAAIAPAGATLLRKNNHVPKDPSLGENPMDHATVGDILPDEPLPRPKGQQYNHQYVPVSPPAAGDLSDSDPGEYADSWQGRVAEMVDDMSPDMVRRFESSTCDSVCAVCQIYAAQQEEGMCECYSTCKMGECGEGSGRPPHIGWSNNEVTTPETRWQAQCNVGEKNCASQCTKKELKKQIADCQKGKGSPAECLKKLRIMHLPLPMDSRKQVHYCTRKGMTTCDTFMNVPTDNGWLCYQHEFKCKEKVVIGFKIPFRVQSSPSVWESVR